MSEVIIMVTSSFFNEYMIELTTGVVFLMSSLYGAGPAQNQTHSIPTPVVVVEQATTTQSVFLTDSKAIEQYIRKTYVNEPLLVDIARCESTFRQYDADGQVVRGRVNKADVGVMQINEKYHSDEAIRLGLDIYTVEGNVAYAKHLYDKFGAQPWSASSPCWAKPGAELARN